MRYIKMIAADAGYGEGIRTVLCISGCSMHCRNCDMPKTADFNRGDIHSVFHRKKTMTALEKPYIQGLTICGGNPFDDAPYDNLNDCIRLCSGVRARLPRKDIWIYSGSDWDLIRNSPLLELVDVVIEGKYEKSKVDISLPFYMSSNQRIIDVRRSLDVGDVVLWRSKY